MLQSTFAVAFLALAAIPGTLAGWNGHATTPATNNCVRSCAAGEEQGCPTLCKKIGLREGCGTRASPASRFVKIENQYKEANVFFFPSNSGACWCTNDDTKSFINADRPVDDKRDEIKTYRETKA
ncbi:hypothetical protein CSIM01_12154 [Colletotrichum simmondsii]|uniref:Uncharacterized protein n=1 Tax=Colletotrichum simmondsii TaxID=703756 RepID=A0A135TM67_9PEZI|nr:hypothetical protein CSIM01_12154 [Colletotrichum simmondsii]